MIVSARSQTILVWWSLIFAVIFGVALGFLIQMLPPPAATLSADEIRDWYLQRSGEIKLGAVIASWTSGFLLPLLTVIGLQIARLERGRPVWGVLTPIAGAMSSLFLVLPPIFFGVAAFTPGRSADATATMHELGVLTLVTTTQYFIFCWAGMIVASLVPKAAAASPFPRWFGYYSIWLVGMFELGAFAFLTRTGPFSWNGLFVFYCPFILFGIWIGVVVWKLLGALKVQRAEEEAELALEASVA
jgi:hypothetical protein